MHHRAKIPALALLGLSCVERSSPDLDPIVGEWQAVEIDAEAFPMMVTEHGDMFQEGWMLDITAEHVGKMISYHQAEQDGVTERYEYTGDLTVDVDAAPKYRLTIRPDLIGALEGPDYPDTGYGDTDYNDTGYSSTYGTITITTNPTGYSDSGYDPTATATATDTGGATDGTSGGATDGTSGGASTGVGTGGLVPVELGAGELELKIRLTGVSAPEPPPLILDCELKAELLTCQRQLHGADDDGELKQWRFKKRVDEQHDK